MEVKGKEEAAVNRDKRSAQGGKLARRRGCRIRGISTQALGKLQEKKNRRQPYTKWKSPEASRSLSENLEYLEISREGNVRRVTVATNEGRSKH